MSSRHGAQSPYARGESVALDRSEAAPVLRSPKAFFLLGKEDSHV